MLLGSPRPINYLPGAVSGRVFNGSTDAYTTAIDLTAETKVTIAVWLKQTSWSGADTHLFDMASDGTNRELRSFLRTGGTPGQILLGRGGSYVGFAQPTVGVPHHYIFSAPLGAAAKFYVDGSVQAILRNDGNSSGHYSNNTLHLMNSNSGGEFDAGTLGLFGMWGSAVTLTDAEIARLVNGEAPLAVHPTNLLLHVESF